MMPDEVRGMMPDVVRGNMTDEVRGMKPDVKPIHETFTRLYNRALADLTENLLPWWMTYAVDEENGGFFGVIDDRNQPVVDAPKYITLQARLVWTFSSAYRILGHSTYLEMANRAYRYLIDHFWDKDFDGCYTQVDAAGIVLDDHKFIYGNAFALYGLSEYARATSSAEAADYANRLFNRLETHVYDPIYKGYFEACTRDWQVQPWLRGVNRVPTDVKTMNTHLHLIEAYTGYLRIHDTPQVRNKVREHLYVMLNKIVNHDIHHYHYFQDRKWAPTSTAISYGHDIEGSWLMMETAEVLGEPEAYRSARDTCVNMARASLEEGLRTDGAMLTDYDPATREASQHLSWWEQNEAVVGFLNAWELTDEDQFLDAAQLCFDYIDRHFIDHDGGGWFPTLTLDGQPVPGRAKGNGTTCPYHNGRMSMEIIERYRRHLDRQPR